MNKECLSKRCKAPAEDHAMWYVVRKVNYVTGRVQWMVGSCGAFDYPRSRSWYAFKRSALREAKRRNIRSGWRSADV